MPDPNPYASPLVQQSAPRSQRGLKGITPLIGAYFGTACAGGVFGLMAGVVGVIIGIILAGITGFFVFTTISALAIASQARVNHTWLGTIAGALTGFFSLTMFFIPGLASMGIEEIVYGIAFALIPASLGALGGFLGALLAGARRSTAIRT